MQIQLIFIYVYFALKFVFKLKIHTSGNQTTFQIKLSDCCTINLRWIID